MHAGRISIIGSRGCLGAEFMEVLPRLGFDAHGVDLPRVDITDPDCVREYLEEIGPDVVINAAAFTAVDRAESEPEEAFRVNQWGAEVVAREAVAVSARLVFFSTDFVFAGVRAGVPYTEEDRTEPRSVYAKSKLAGEKAVLNVNSEAIVLRIGGLYGRHGKNFFSTLPLRILKREDLVLDDERKVSPTWSRCVVQQTCELLGKRSVGLYHATCQGEATWAQFGGAICQYLQVEETFKRVPSARLVLPAPRPGYGVLDNRKLRVNGLDIMPSWRDALHAYLDTILEIQR